MSNPQDSARSSDNTDTSDQSMEETQPIENAPKANGQTDGGKKTNEQHTDDPENGS